MAKKRKKEKAETEEYEFTPPEFDEKEFLKKELSDIKIGLITMVFAVSLGVVAGVITLINDEFVIVAFFVGIAGIAVLKQFYAMVKVDTSEFKKKNWAGNIATLFFTFLAIWVLLMNVPFADHASPDIEEVVVWVTVSGQTYGIQYELVNGAYVWVSTDPANHTAAIPVGATEVNITAKVSDNGKLSDVKISNIMGTAIPPTEMTSEGSHRFGYKVTPSALGSALDFNIQATDSEGNTRTFSPDVWITVG